MRYEADHPAPADLLAAYLGTLDPEDRDPIEEHLSTCGECAQAVLDFEAFPDLPPVDAEEDDMEMGRALKARLEEQKRGLIERSREEVVEPQEQMPSRALVPVEGLRSEAPSQSRTASWFASPAVAWAVAAMFFVATVGLGVWNRSPSVPGDLGTIEPVEATIISSRSPGDLPKQVALEGDRTVFRLLLQDYAKDHPEYRVILVEERSGEQVGSELRIEVLPPNNLLVTMPHSLVSAGDYHFEVVGVEAGEDIPIGRVRVQLVEPEAGAAPE